MPVPPEPNPLNPDDAADPADLNDPNPIASVDPGADSAPQTIDDTAGPDDPNARTVAAMLDEAESRLEAAERDVADLLVGKMTDVPIEREDIVLSQTGDSTRPGRVIPTPRANDADMPVVTAAVDMTKMGGFDADGDWHDSFGRYARKGWSALKHAALEVLRDDPNRAHLQQHGPTRLRVKDRDLARRLGAADGMVLARLGDATHAVVNDSRGRPVRVPWDRFDRDQPNVRDRTLGEHLFPTLPGPAPRNLMLPGAERGAANDLPDESPEALARRIIPGNLAAPADFDDTKARLATWRSPKAKAAGVPPRIDSEYDDTVLDEYDTPDLPAAPAPAAPAEVSLDPEVNRALIDADNVASLTHGTDVGHYNVFTKDGSGDLRNVPYADLPAGAKAWLVESDRRWNRGRFAPEAGASNDLPGADRPTVNVDDLTPDSLIALADRYTSDAAEGRRGEATVMVDGAPVSLEWDGYARFYSPRTAQITRRVWVNGDEVIDTTDDWYGDRDGDGDPTPTGLDVVEDPDAFAQVIDALRSAKPEPGTANDMPAGGRPKWASHVIDDPLHSYDPLTVDDPADLRQGDILIDPDLWTGDRVLYRRNTDGSWATLTPNGELATPFTPNGPTLIATQRGPAPKATPTIPDTPTAPDNPDLHGTWHILRGSRYVGEHNITQATARDGHPGWYDVTSPDGWRHTIRPEDMFPTEEAARAAARDRRNPRRSPEEMRQATAMAGGDWAAFAQFSRINPQTGRKYTTRDETTISNTPDSTGTPNDLLTPARIPTRAQQHHANRIRDLAYATNPNDLQAITEGRPIIDVAYATDTNGTLTLTRTTGILTTDGRYLTAGTEAPVTLPDQGDAYRMAESYARSIAGDDTWARVRQAGATDGDMIAPYGGAVNDMPGDWVPDPNEKGQFPTVEKLDAASVRWDTQPDPDFPEDTRSALNIATQYLADPNDDAHLNEVQVRIFGSEGRYDWWVDGANAMEGNFLQRFPSDFGGAFDWPDPTQAAPWAESGYARTLPEAQAQALDAVNRLPMLATVRPVDMIHTGDTPKRVLDRLKEWRRSRPTPRRGKWSDRSDYRLREALAEASAAAPAESPWTPQRWTDPNQGNLFPEAGASNDMPGAPAEVMSLFGTFVDLADDAHGRRSLARFQSVMAERNRDRRLRDFDALIDDEGWDPDEFPEIAPVRAWLASAEFTPADLNVLNDLPEAGAGNDLLDSTGRIDTEDRRIEGRSSLGGITVLVPAGMTGPVPVDDVIEPTPNVVTATKVNGYEVNTYHMDQPTQPDTSRLAKRWEFDTEGGSGVVVRYSGSTNYQDPTRYDLLGTRHGGSPMKAAYLPDADGIVTGGINWNRLDLYPARARTDRSRSGSWHTAYDDTPIGTVVIDRARNDGKVSGTLFSGQTDKPGNYLKVESPDFDTEDDLARWAAEQIGDPRLAYQRVDRPSGVNEALLNTPAPNGVVIIRGTMAQPFLDAISPRDAIIRASNDRYPGRNAFTAPDGALDTTKVLILTPDSAARWKAAYEGVQAAQDAAKAERAAKAAARKAARQAREQVIPDGNDLIDMPPADRALAATTPTGAWLIAKDNYLSRLGVERGQAVRVRADGDQGVIDVLDGDTVRPQRVKWDRFSDAAPADAPKVDVPEASGNAAVADKASAAKATAQRVQAAGTGGAPVEVADNYLTRYGAPKGSVITVSYLDDRNAVLNVEGRQVKAGWSRFTPRVPEPDGQGGWNLLDPPEPEAGAANDLPGEADDTAREMLRQIGNITLLAISGGRREVHTTPSGDPLLRLPVGNGYRVDVIYDRASDTYTVNRVFSRGGKDFPKGTMTYVYADQLSDIAYLASSFRSHPFGTGTSNDLVALPNGEEGNATQLNLLDLAPNEIRQVALATTDFAEHGWYPTDAIGGFRSPDGAVTVTRAGGGWKAVDRRRSLFSTEGEMTGRDADAIVEWANQRSERLASTPTDTTKVIDDDRLVAYAADPAIHLYPASDLLPTGPRDKARYGIVARNADGTFAEVVGRWKSPAEAQGAWDDLTRRLTGLGANDDPKVLDAIAPTLGRPADVKAAAVKRGDWVHRIQGADGTGRVASATADPETGQVTLYLSDDMEPIEVPAVAAVSIVRPVRTDPTPDVPTYTESAAPETLARMAPDEAEAVRSAAVRVAQVAPVGSERHAHAVRVATDAERALGGNDLPETVDGKTVTATSIVLDPNGAPPAPKAAPVPDGAVRLFHYPTDDPKLDYTLDTGITGRWAQTFPPVGDVTPYVEFWATPDEIAAGDAASDYGHVALAGPIPADRIVSYSTPTLDALRRFRNAPTLWTADRLRSTLGRYPAGSPEHAAILARLAEMGADLAEPGASNDLRPFAIVRRAMTKVPDRAYLIALAGMGVPNGNGQVPTLEQIEEMSPSELVALDRAMSRWLAAHPYGDYSGADPLDVRVAADAPADAPAAARRRQRRRTSPGIGVSGYVPMSPLDAPADAVAAALSEVFDIPILADDIEDVEMFPPAVADVPIVAGMLSSREHEQRVAAGRASADRRRKREMDRAYARRKGSGGQTGPTVIEGHFPEFPLRPANGAKTPAEEAAALAPQQVAEFMNRVNQALDGREQITADYDSIVNLADGMVKSGWQVAESEPGVLRVTDPRNPGRYFDMRSTPRPARPGQ